MNASATYNSHLLDCHIGSERGYRDFIIEPAHQSVLQTCSPDETMEFTMGCQKIRLFEKSYLFSWLMLPSDATITVVYQVGGSEPLASLAADHLRIHRTSTLLMRQILHATACLCSMSW